MKKKYQKTNVAELESLASFRKFIAFACEDVPRIDEQFLYDMQLAVDEACTNIITHGYAGMNPGSIILEIELDEEQVVITITDFGHPFEPSEPDPPDMESFLSNRETGGFGLFFIYQSMDQVNYETTMDGNRLILTKMLR